MKLGIKIENGTPYFWLRYEGNEWEEIKSILQKLGLKERVTEQGFGMGEVLKYYRETNTELKNYIQKTLLPSRNEPTWEEVLNIYDDINNVLIHNDRVNIAIFRVVPNSKGEVNIRLDKFLTVADLRQIVLVLQKVYEKLFNVQLEKTIKFKVCKVTI